MLSGASFIRRKLMIRLVRAFDAGTLRDELDRMPIELRPKDGEHSRWCIYRDRAILKYRLMAILGISVEDETDETKMLKEYFDDKAEGRQTEKPESPLSVCGPACSGCPDAKVVSTSNCRGCFARPCVYNCPKKAISIVNGRSFINQELCIKCGKCVSACPMGLEPYLLSTLSAQSRWEDAEKNEVTSCIECGSCQFTCPSHRPLLDMIRVGKSTVMGIIKSRAAKK